MEFFRRETVATLFGGWPREMSAVIPPKTI